MELEKNARIYAGIPEDSPQDLKYCVMDKKAKYDAFIAGANAMLEMLYHTAYKEDWITNPKDGVKRFFQIYKKLKDE